MKKNVLSKKIIITMFVFLLSATTLLMTVNSVVLAGLEDGPLPDGLEDGPIPDGLEDGPIPDGLEDGPLPDGLEDGPLPDGLIPTNI